MKQGIKKYLSMVLAFVMVFSLVNIEGVRAEWTPVEDGGSCPANDTYVGTVTIGDVTTCYTAEEFEGAISGITGETEATVKVLGEYTLTSNLEIDGNITFMGGTIHQGENLDILVNGGGSLTVTGGTIDTEIYVFENGELFVNGGTLKLAIYVKGGTAVINGGEIGAIFSSLYEDSGEQKAYGGTVVVNGGEVNSIIANYITLEITGGTITEDVEVNFWGLNVEGATSLTTITGGTIQGSLKIGIGKVNINDGRIGTLYVKEKGEVIISGGTINNINNWSSIESITIPEDNKSVVLNANSATLTVGGTQQLTATVNPIVPSSVASVSWSSDNEAVATVVDGLITAVSAGNATIIAKYGEKTATCTVTVSKKTYSITINPISNGSVTVDGSISEASEGTVITLIVTPDENYELDTLNVKNESGNSIPVTEYKFAMPASKVTVEATFKEKAPIVIGQVTLPAADVASGTYTENKTVTLTTDTKDAKIYYTLDGSNPATSSDLYSKPIVLTGIEGQSKSYTLKAMAVKEGMINSIVAEYTYTINLPKEEIEPNPEPVKPIRPTKPNYKEEVVKNDDVTISGEFNGKVEIKEPSKDSDGYKDTVGKVDEKDTIIDEIEIKVPSHKGDVEISVDMNDKYNDKNVTVIYGNGKETNETVGKVVDGKLSFSIGDMTGNITVLVVEKHRELDLSAYADGLLPVYTNSRVTSISLTEQGFKLSGYAFVKDMSMDYINQHKLVREIVFVNEEDESTSKAYRQPVTATNKGSFLTSNHLLNPTGQIDYTYATYDVEVKYNEIMNYKKKMSVLEAGKYRIYIRVSDGKHAYLMPLKDLVLSDGSTLTLPSNMELVDEEERSIIFNQK